ncbi:MAG: rhomboid family intramembrane serine protease [Bacteroidota bacterium]
MIFPIGDDQVQGGSKPLFSYAFIVINVLVFLYEMSLSPDALNQFITEFGSIPAETMRGEDYFSLFTSMFLHGGWMHLIGNMLFLWVFADNIEQVIGNFNFLIFYIAGGLAAHAGHIFFNIDSTIPTVGASGAISAVLGAYLVMFPTSKIKILVVILFSSFRISALVFLGLWIGQQLISGIGAISQTAEASGVAWWAHIGGFAFGIIAGFYYRRVEREQLVAFRRRRV